MSCYLKMNMRLIYKFEQALLDNYDSSITRNRSFIELAKRQTTIYAKFSNLSPGFWGINENQIDKLKSKNNNWIIVLLLRNLDTDRNPIQGYYLNPQETNKLINDPNTSRSSSDFKIHEPELQRHNIKFFGSISQFLDFLG